MRDDKKIISDFMSQEVKVGDLTYTVGQLSAAFALCPLDGRYASIEEKLAPYFSEFALVKYRVNIEVNWIQFQLEKVNCEFLEKFDAKSCIEAIDKTFNDFTLDDYFKVKEIEKRTNHDVKAVELFVAEKLESISLGKLKSFVHIGCTSEDITNLAYGGMISTALNNVWVPAAEELISIISEMAIDNSDTAMLAHTHGQPATPTTVGKELLMFAYRLQQSVNHIKSIKICGKFNGATGNYAAISMAFPNENWPVLAKEFVEDYIGLEFNPVTTQIESHDYMAHIFDGICHFNNVLLDFDRDMWLYISMEYFKQITVKNEVGSSTMPHKVNPIRFENSESNIDTSNALFTALSRKLPISRMQRDLSDSSSQRNIGLAFGYSIQAIEQTIGGLKKVEVNEEKLSDDLDNNYAVLAEPIQTVLRKYGVPDAYDKLKEMTRGKKIGKEDIHIFIESLEMLSEEDKSRLLELTPEKYTGLAAQIVEDNL